MPIIRKEINIVDREISVSADTVIDERIVVDHANYTGATYYFEVVAKNTNASARDIVFRTEGGTTFTNSTISIPGNTTSYTRFRSGAITGYAVNNPMTIRLMWITSGVLAINRASFLIIQDDPLITNTQSLYEIGSYQTGLIATGITALTDAKYWLYTAANWDATKNFFAEVVYAMTSTKSSITIRLQEDNGSFAGWADKVTIVNAGTLAVPTKVRVSFTPVDGRHYRLAYLVASSKTAGAIYNGNIVITQSSPVTYNESFVATATGTKSVQGSGGTAEAASQSFTTLSAYSLNAINIGLKKVASPTDNLYVEIRATSPTGTLLATSDDLDGSTLTTSNVMRTFTFPSPPSLSNATEYWIILKRDGARDTTNYYAWANRGFTSYSGGGSYTLDSGTWSSVDTVNDQHFGTNPVTVYVTKFEDQYMMLSHADAGTGLQNGLQKWDSAEWSGVTNVYKFEHESTNAADSSKLRDVTAAADVSGATVTGANQQISSGFTMPSSGNTIDTNVTVSTGVVTAVRVLVLTEITSSVTTTKTIDGVARIQAVTTKTETGKAAIQKTTTQTETGVARIQKAVTKTITGVATLLVFISQFIDGKARIQKSVTQTEAGKARIQKAVAQTIQGLARITAATARTIQGVARITASTTKNITGLAQIRVTTTKTITGKARIQKVVTATIQGVSRITAATARTIQGLARITASTTRNITGLAKITATTTKTESGISRIQKSATQTETGLARIQKAVTQTIQGLARITAATTRTIQGLARITASTLRTIQGVARITASTLRTISGKANIQNSTTRTETGVSRIEVSRPLYLSEGANSPDTAVNDGGIGTIAWSNPGNILSSDDSRATAVVDTGEKSNYLKATDFDFNIPSDAIIEGILVEWERSKTGSGSGARDHAVRIVKGGTIGSTDRSSGADWPTTTDAYASYGSSTDKWGETWAPSDINASDFGSALSAGDTTGNLFTLRVDHVRITVYYRIGNSVVTGVSRITAATSRTITGKANIEQAASNQDIDGVARIEKVVTRTETGISRIQKAIQATIDGLARIQKSVTVRTTLSTLLSPSTMANDTAEGVMAWLNVDNAKESDNVYSTTTPFTGETETRTSYYLKATNFGFRIPAGATISGIKAEVERKKNTTSVVIDHRVKIVKADGSFGSENKAGFGAPLWSNSDTYREYGGEGDLWSETWTPADINDEDFGFGFSVSVMSDDNNVFASVDHMRITVYYYVDSIFGVARIQKAVTQTIQGVSRIQKSIAQTIDGKSRIQKVVPQNITGVASVIAIISGGITGRSRITAAVAQTIQGVARIQKAVQQTIAGVARIQKAISVNITGTSRIQKSVTQNITGKAAIQNTTTRTITGVARIQFGTDRTIQGVARIQISTTRNETGVARITAVASRTETGVARIVAMVLRTITGVSRIMVSTIKIETGIARIQKAVTRTETGTARIRKTATQTETGVARVQKLVAGSVTGKARIQKAVDKTETGKARIQYTTVRDINGKATIVNTAQRTETGKARISIVSTKNITGTARIRLPRVFPYKHKVVKPYLVKDGPYSNKTSPYSPKTGPYSPKTGPYADFPPDLNNY